MIKAEIRSTSIQGIKRRAKEIGKAKGLPHHQALLLASKEATFENYPHARRVLTGESGNAAPKHRLFLTCYWRDRETYAAGRETIEVRLATPPLEICSRLEMRRVRGLSAMRPVAPDHFVADQVSQSQDFARDTLSKCVRSLLFMQATGLRPCDFKTAQRAKKDLDEKLPRKDHATDWVHPATGQFVLVDEPYLDPMVDGDRAAWAARNKWHLRAARWPGMYNPPWCALFVATSATAGFDIDFLMRQIDALPTPVTPENWPGTSSEGHEVFVSPMAITPQDRRRARAKGTVVAQQSRFTVPCPRMLGTPGRKPRGSMPLSEHVEAGRIIKAVLHSAHKPWAVNHRMGAVRNRLEDWLYAEIPQKQRVMLDAEDTYYGDLPRNDPFIEMAASATGVGKLLLMLRMKLANHYPDCAPLRQLLHRIDLSQRYVHGSAA